MALCPGKQLRPANEGRDDGVKSIPLDKQYEGKFFLHYFSFMRPSSMSYHFDDTTEYDAYILDTWECTKTYAGSFRGPFTLQLPSKQYMAVMLIAK